MRIRRLGPIVWIALALLSTGVVVGGARAQAPPSAGWAFEVPPLGPELYGIQEPSENPVLQRRWVVAKDGVRLFVETWLPKARDGRLAPLKVPTVLVMSPYAMLGRIPNSGFNLRDDAVPRGYAYSVMHLRGTGESGGCYDHHGPIALEDAMRVVEHVAGAPWSDGKLALIGLSNPGGEAIHVAADGTPSRTASIKALIVGAPADLYQANAFDGVPPYVGVIDPIYYPTFGVFPETSPLDPVLYLTPPEDVVTRRLEPGGVVSPSNAPGRAVCVPEHTAAWADKSGDMTPYWLEREIAKNADRITAPTLMFHGLADPAVPARGQAGLFDRIRVPKAGIFGVFRHETPEHHETFEPHWQRADFKPMAMAWLDRWVRGIDTGVERWPVAQVQDNTGQWHAEGNWPTTGGPVGQLALSDGGLLGSMQPTGSSSFVEVPAFDRSSPVQVEGSFVEFRSPSFSGPLHITGQVVLDAWIETNKDDAHIGAELHAYDADGQPITYGSISGFRSLRHLDPIQDGLFLQQEGRPAPVAPDVVHVPIRFNITDLVVPAGGHLELRIAGTARWSLGIPLLEHPNVPSGNNATIKIRHDCSYPTTLRFLMARRHSDLLNVRERGETELTTSIAHPSPTHDAGGLATDRVCGRAPERVEGVHGEAFEYHWRP